MEETPNKTPQINEDNLIRVDKNLSKHSIDWIMDFGNDAMLCFDILIYITSCSQKNLFQFGTIDLDKFAKEMGHHKPNLQRIRENGNKVTIEERLEGKKPVTFFEHALFKLAKSNFQFTTTVYDPSRHETIEKNKFIQIIKDINIHIPNGKNKTKIYYTYSTSEEFDYNLSRYFFFIDPTQIKKLRERGLMLLYFYVKNLENSKFTTFVEVDFRKICQLAGFSISNDELIRKEKYKLKKKLDTLKKLINFEYEFIRVSGRYKYGIKFFFPDNANLLNSPELKKISENKDLITLRKANNDFIDLKLIKHYQESFKDFNSANYKAWYRNKARDLDIKLDIYFSCIAELYHITKVKARKNHYKDALDYFQIKEV